MITADIRVNTLQVAHVTIWNDDTGTKARGNYQYQVTVADEVRKGSILRFRRAHPHGAVQLLREVLRREFPFLPGNEPAAP